MRIKQSRSIELTKQTADSESWRSQRARVLVREAARSQDARVSIDAAAMRVVDNPASMSLLSR